MAQFDEAKRTKKDGKGIGFAEMILLAVRRCDELVSNLYDA